jgi:hypothetical protein
MAANSPKKLAEEAVAADLARFPNAKAYARGIPPPAWYTPQIEAIDSGIVYKIKKDLNEALERKVNLLWSTHYLTPAKILKSLAAIKYLLKLGANPFEGKKPSLFERVEAGDPFESSLLKPYKSIFIELFELGPKLAKEAHPSLSDDTTHLEPTTLDYLLKKVIRNNYTYLKIFPLILANDLSIVETFPYPIQCNLLKAWATYICANNVSDRTENYAEWGFVTEEELSRIPVQELAQKKEVAFLFSEKVPFELLRDCFVPIFFSKINLTVDFTTGHYTRDVNTVLDCIDKFVERGERIGSFLLRSVPSWFLTFIQGKFQNYNVLTQIFDHMTLDDTLGFQQVYSGSGIREPLTLLELFVILLPPTEYSKLYERSINEIFFAFVRSILKQGADPLMRLRPLEVRDYKRVYTIPEGATLFSASMRATNGVALDVFLELDSLPYDAILASIPEAKGVGLLTEELAAQIVPKLEAYPKLRADHAEAAAASEEVKTRNAALLEHTFNSNIDKKKRTLFTIPSYVTDLANLIKGIDAPTKTNLLQEFLKKPHTISQLQALLLTTTPLPPIHEMEHLDEYNPLVEIVKRGLFPPAEYTLPRLSKPIESAAVRLYFAEFPFDESKLIYLIEHDFDLSILEEVAAPFFSRLFVSNEEGEMPPALELEADQLQDLLLQMSPDVYDVVSSTGVSVFKYCIWYAQTHPNVYSVDPKFFWERLLKHIPLKHLNSPDFARYLLGITSTQYKKIPYLLRKLYEVGFLITTPVSREESAQSLFLSLFDFLYGKEGSIVVSHPFFSVLVASPGFDFAQAKRDVQRKAAERPLTDYQLLVAHILKTGLWRGHDLEALSQLNEILKSPFQVSMCPICLGVVPRSAGCMYMTHNCKAASPFYSTRLYEKYRDAKGNITWCNFCSRICFTEYYMADPGDGVLREMMRHFHMALVPDNAPRPGAAIPGAAGMADPFSVDCVQLGGGGLPEKLVRLVARREAAERFQSDSYVAQRAFSDVQDAIIGTCWNAPLDGEERPAVDAFMQRIFQMLQPRIDALLADPAFFPGFPEDRRRVTAYQRAGETAFSEEELASLLEYWASIANLPDALFPPQNIRLRQQEAYLGEAAINALRNLNVPRPRLPENAPVAAAVAAGPGAGAAALPAAPPVDPLAPILVPVPQPPPPPPPPPAPGQPAPLILECKTCFYDTKPRLWRFSHRLTLPPAAPDQPPQYGRGALHVHPETDMICDQCIRTAIRARLEVAGQGIGDLGKCIQGCGAVLWPEELQPMINPPYVAPVDGDVRPVLDQAFVDQYRRAFNLAMNRGLLQGGAAKTRRQQRKKRAVQRGGARSHRTTLRNSMKTMGKNEPRLSPIFFLDDDTTLHCAVESKQANQKSVKGGHRSSRTRRLKRRPSAK